MIVGILLAETIAMDCERSAFAPAAQSKENDQTLFVIVSKEKHGYYKKK